MLPADTARTWLILSGRLPDGLVLYGGTAIAAHLHHRVSRDLDFFYTDDLDLAGLRRRLADLGTFAVTQETADTLNGVFNATKVQFLRTVGQLTVEPTIKIADIDVAGMRDLAATKLKVVGDRGELRDYFDLMVIDQRTSTTVEAALLDYQQRYHVDSGDPSIDHIVKALGFFGDVADDPEIPGRRGIEAFWRSRQRRLVAALSATGTIQLSTTAPVRTAPAAPAGRTPSGQVWVEAHQRDSRRIEGYWRRR